MTTFKLLSDLHLEFYPTDNNGNYKHIYRPPVEKDDKNTVLILAGDIHVGEKALPWIQEMAQRFRHVIYILGNHEFYGQEWYKTIEFWEGIKLDDFTFLHDDYMVIDHVRIFGGTLWTDVKDPVLQWHGRQMMNDYSRTHVNEHRANVVFRRLNVQDTNNAHATTVRKLRDWLQVPWEGKTMVITHHLPHELCIHEKYKGSTLNPFFCTNLDDLIADHKIDVWCHGHTHDNVDVKIHETRILCNPMGYHGYEMNPDFNEELRIEI